MADALVARERESAEISALLERAETDGAVCVIAGPAGIGKSVLLTAGADEAETRGRRVLRARAGERDRGFAFGIVHQLFERAVSDDRGASLLTGAAERAAGVFGPADGLDAGESYAVQSGLYWLVVHLAEEAPVVLVIDDLQWADQPSLRFLEYLGRRLEGLPVLVLCSLRTAEPDVPADLLTAIEEGPEARTLRPQPLDDDAVGDVMARMLPGAPEPGFVRAAARATGGNPLLLSLLGREAVAAGLSGIEGEGDRLAQIGSQSVGAIVSRRLRSLGTIAVSVARAAAMLGPRAPFVDLVTVSEHAPGEVREALEKLSAVQILDADSWAFVHPLVETAVVATCPAVERDRLHRSAALAARARGAHPAEIARHWLAAVPAGDARAVDDLRAAAAAADGAPEAAITLLHRALNEPPDTNLLGLVLVEAGEAEVRAGHPAGPGHLRQALGLLPPGNDAARARAALGTHLVHADPVAALEEVRLGAEQAQDPGLRLRLEAFTLEAFVFPDAASDAREAAFAAGRAHPAPSSVMLAHLAVDDACRGASADTVARTAERALADGSLLSAIGPGSSTWNLVTHAFRFAEAAEREHELLLEADRWVLRRGAQSARFFVEQTWGYWHRDFGSVAVGAARARLGHQVVTELGLPLTEPVLAAVVAENLVHLDRIEEAAALMEQPLGAAEHTYMEPFILVARGWVRALGGRLDAAEADLRRVREFSARRGWVAPNVTRAGLRLAHVLLRAGRTAEAADLLDAELALARSAGLPGSVGTLLRLRARTVDREHSLTMLREATDVLAATAFRLDHGWAAHDLGAALNRLGMRREAREPLRVALDAATRSESTRLARYTRAQLDLSGARPRRTSVAGADALTAAERRVCDLATEGRTNREIAEALWITPKTVEVHLSRSYAKLGVMTRRDLPRALGQLVSAER